MVRPAYDPANRLVTAVDGSGSTSYTFDADGNQRSVETPAGDLTTSTWNVSSQNTAVEQPDGSLVSFVWNSDDVRIVRDDGIDQVRYVWDRHNILLETDEFGQTLSRSTYEQAGFGRLISRDTGGETAYYHYDALGSTRELTDAAEVVTDEYTFRAFGETAAETGSTENHWKCGRLG